MEKDLHPCYSKINPTAEARKYTSENVHYRKATLVYDWLDTDRDVRSWLRRVPYRLERDDSGGSWVVKYFEFRAGISPIKQLGFVGDLWVSWNSQGPSVWFKVDEEKWERWGGCARSVCGHMDAKHPFLDKAYLWFDPKEYFFLGSLPKKPPSLKWEKLCKIRRVAPVGRIVDPDHSTSPKKNPRNPIYLPSIATIVRALCPHAPRSAPMSRRISTPLAIDRGEGCSNIATAGPSGIGVERPQGPFPMEEIELGNGVEFDWDWWGNTDDDAEATQVGGSQPQRLSPTPTPTPTSATLSRTSRYHPYQLNSSPTPARYARFRPPRRYTEGEPPAITSPNNLYSTPSSSFASTSSTVVNRAPSLPFGEDIEEIEREEVGWHEIKHPQKPSQRTLRGIVKILRENGYDHSGIWALLLVEFDDTDRDLAAALPVPVLDPKPYISNKIKDLLREEGFVTHGVLVLNVLDSDEDDGVYNGSD